jgi:hypothetical protein
MRTRILEDLSEAGCLESRTLCAELFSKCAMSSEASFCQIICLRVGLFTSLRAPLSSLGCQTQAVTIPGRAFGRPRPVGRPMTQCTCCTSGARTLLSVDAQSINWYLCFANDSSGSVSSLHVASSPYHQHYMPQIGSGQLYTLYGQV